MTGEKIRKPINWWYVPAVICGIVTAISIVAYIITVNMALIMLILPGVVGTAFSVYKSLGMSGIQVGGISELGPMIGECNSFCIYGKLVDGVKLADKVQFENIKDNTKLKGDRWYFEDLGRWFYVMVNELDKDCDLTAFELPDAAYTDPARLSVLLNMGRVNELFQLEPSLFDQLKPLILFAAVSVVGFLIFLSGSE